MKTFDGSKWKDSVEDYVPLEMDKYQNVAVGRDSLHSAQNLRVRNNNAYGIGALYSATRARYNDAFGLNALYSLDSGPDEPDSTFKATRNSAFGSNTQRFNKTGYNNVTMGRNSLQCNESGTHNIFIGAGSAAGLAPIGLGGLIENQIPQNVSYNTAVGTDTLANILSDNNTAMGYAALRNLKIGTGNTAVGANALTTLENSTFPGGGWEESIGWTNVPYSSTNTATIEILKSNSGMEVGELVQLSFSGQEDQRLKVSSVKSDSFSVTTPQGNSSVPSTGTVTVVAKGKGSARNNNFNTALGMNALQYLDNKLEDAGASGSNTAIGVHALRYMVDGTPTKNLSNSIGIGVSSRVSGDYQIALGYTGTTPYAYAALQLRSDERDKSDIRDTKLGLDFIEKVRPVDFKYDYRSDYQETNDDGDVVSVNERDGSKKRDRYHHGVIAQEIAKIIEETGIDFGGYQDHKINGGNDVLTIGYEEFIGPMIKAIQELSIKVDELESRLEKYENV